MISRIVRTDEMFQTTLIISEDHKKLHCRICAIDQGALICNNAIVAIVTTQVVLNLYQTFKALLHVVSNSFMIFFAKNYA